MDDALSESVPDDGRKYATTHEWVKQTVEKENGVEQNILLVGITEHACHQLGDIIYIGDFKNSTSTEKIHLDKGALVGVVESVKATSELYTPVGGTLLEYNVQLESHPHQLNTDPYDLKTAWIFKLIPDNFEDLDTLLDATQYQALTQPDASFPT